MFLLHSSFEEGISVRQNEHLNASFCSISRNILAWWQPSQMTLLQHWFMIDFDRSSCIGKQQIGQSPRWVLSDCLNNNSSLSSAARLLQASSCCGQCSLWHAPLQYFTWPQSVQFFNLISSISATPQEAQHDVSTASIFSSLILYHPFQNVLLLVDCVQWNSNASRQR